MTNKPCPFCGSYDLRESKNMRIINNTLDIQVTEIQCMNCGASGPSSVFVPCAIDGWNKRHEDLIKEVKNCWKHYETKTS